jgi:hypothetical protein
MVSERAPDWGWWRHVPTVALHEAVALTLNIDPKQLRRASTRNLLAGRQFEEGPEFEMRLALAKRCLGDTLPGPLNSVSLDFEGGTATVRLREFAKWALSVEWHIPPELTRLLTDDRDHPTVASNRHFISGREAAAKSRIDAEEPEKSTSKRTVLPSGIRTTTDEKVEAACGNWISKLAERPRDKEAAFDAAKSAVAHIGVLSRKAFDRQWASKAPADWKQAGRRKR